MRAEYYILVKTVHKPRLTKFDIEFDKRETMGLKENRNNPNGISEAIKCPPVYSIC